MEALPEKIWVKYQSPSSAFAYPILFMPSDIERVDDVRELMCRDETCPESIPDFLIIVRDPTSRPSSSLATQWYAIRVHRSVIMAAIPSAKPIITAKESPDFVDPLLLSHTSALALFYRNKTLTTQAHAIYFGNMTKPMVQTIIIYLYQSTSACTIDSPSAFTTSDTTTDAALPPGVEKQITDDGKTYYIDHNTRTTSWDPPGSATQPSHLQLPEHLHAHKTVFLAELYRSACNRSLPGLAGLALREIEACSALPNSPTTGDAPPPDEGSAGSAGGAGGQEEAGDFPEMHEIAESLKIALYGSFSARDQRSERRATLRRALMQVHASAIVEMLLASTTAAGAEGRQLEGASNTDEIDTGLPLAQWCNDDDDFASDLLRYIGLHVFHLHAASGRGDLNEVD